MNTAPLSDAYHELVKSAEAITATTQATDEDRADVDWRLAHIQLSDRLLAAAARDFLAGRTVMVDNKPSVDPRAIDGVISTTSHTERIDAVRRGAAELLELLAQLPDEAHASAVQLRMHNREGEHVSDTSVTWSQLLDLRATTHIPAHTTRFAEVARIA